MEAPPEALASPLTRPLLLMGASPRSPFFSSERPSLPRRILWAFLLVAASTACVGGIYALIRACLRASDGGEDSGNIYETPVFQWNGARGLVESLGEWVCANKAPGVAVFSVIFLTMFMVLLPTTPMEMLAGYIFGFRLAFSVLILLKPIAHVATFMLARRMGIAKAGGAVLRGGALSLFRAIDLAIREDSKVAWQTVFLVCLSLLPAGAKTYGLAAVPAVRRSMLFVCAAVATLPCSLATAYLGSSAQDLKAVLSSGHGSQSQRRVRLVLLCFNAVALLLCVTAIALHTRRALARLAATSEDPERGGGAEAAPASGALPEPAAPPRRLAF